MEFLEFEKRAISLIEKYQGELLLRLRPSANEVISASIDTPFELHIVRFPDEESFEHFKNDPERKRWLHLKEISVREQLLVKGEAIG